MLQFFSLIVDFQSHNVVERDAWNFSFLKFTEACFVA